jgi:hypothetical protein
LLADLSRWREREVISTGELVAVSTEEFSAAGTQGRANLRTPRSLDPLLAFLRQLGVIETRASRTASARPRTPRGHYQPPDDLLAFLAAL